VLGVTEKAKGLKKERRRKTAGRVTFEQDHIVKMVSKFNRIPSPPKQHIVPFASDPA